MAAVIIQLVALVVVVEGVELQQLPAQVTRLVQLQLKAPVVALHLVI
jgi:uncharacterized protein YjeT (DUF2065 family)